MAIVQRRNANLIAIGNGTASRETEQFVANFIQKIKAIKPDAELNYIIVDEVCGTLPVNGALVSLRDAATHAITGGNFSADTVAGNEIGTARIAAIAYHSGTNAAAACKYKLYLYDVNMTGGSFSSVRGVYYDNGSVDFHADIAATDGIAILLDTKFSPFVIPTSYNYVKTLLAYL